MPRRALWRIVLLAGCLLLVGSVAYVSVTDNAGAQIRLVRSSLGVDQRARTLGTVGLYAKNDPWMPYLADERTCPGGERTDLPVAQQRQTLVCLINYARAKRGRSRLAVRDILNGGSLKKALEIIRCRTFAHSPCGDEWSAAVRSEGYQGQFGENLYLATSRWGAPRVVVDAWLNSPPHRENLFAERWREQGLALIWRKQFTGYRDVALWVSVFGVRSPR